MRVAIIGAGYVGLVTGLGFAEHGNEVILVDVDLQKVDMINQAKAPIYEKGLEPLLKNTVGRNLKATSKTKEAVDNAEVIFICVQTGSKDSGAVDLTYIEQAVGDVGKALSARLSPRPEGIVSAQPNARAEGSPKSEKGYREHLGEHFGDLSGTVGRTAQPNGGYPLIAIKSSVAPGTTEKVVVPLLEENSGKEAGVDFGVAVNPEFLSEGRAIEDFFNPDRIVIGEMDRRSGDILFQLYKGFNAPKLRVDLKTAEMIKYASNAFLATKISFISELGNICKRLGIDTYKVADGMGLDPRISPHFLRAGIGFGGSCLPKDVKAIVTQAKELGCQPVLLDSVLKVNEEQPLKLVELAERKAGGLSGKKVAVLGLAFKPGTSDMREAPSIKVVEELLRKGAWVKAYDPEAEGEARKIFGDKIDYATSAEETISPAEMVFILTEWDEFKNPDLYKGKTVFDGRRVLEPDEAKDYEGICW